MDYNFHFGTIMIWEVRICLQSCIFRQRSITFVLVLCNPRNGATLLAFSVRETSHSSFVLSKGPWVADNLGRTFVSGQRWKIYPEEALLSPPDGPETMSDK